MLTSGKSKWQVNSGKCSEKLYTYYTWGHRGAHSKSTGGLGPHFGRHSTGPQLIGLGNKPPCWPVWLEAADPSSSALQTKLSRGLRRCPLCWKLAHHRAEEQRIIGSFHAAHVNTHTHTHIFTRQPPIRMHGYTQLATVKACYAVSQCEEKEEKCIYRWIRWTY